MNDKHNRRHLRKRKPKRQGSRQQRGKRLPERQRFPYSCRKDG